MDCFKWRPHDGPTPYQLEILAELTGRKRVCVRGPHGLGKSAMNAWAILWFALTRDGEDWKVPTTASAWRQLTKFLWPEVKKWSRVLDWEKVGREPFDSRKELLGMNLKLRTGEAFAVASDDPTLIEGAHADHLLYIFDEAKSVRSDTFDAAEGAFSNAGDDTPNEALALAASTPGEPNGRFFDIQMQKPGYEDWWVRWVRVEEAISAGRISSDWVDNRRKQWTSSSAIFLNRVLGEFATTDNEGVIPLPWIEASMERGKALRDALAPDEDTA